MIGYREPVFDSLLQGRQFTPEVTDQMHLPLSISVPIFKVIMLINNLRKKSNINICDGSEAHITNYGMLGR